MSTSPEQFTGTPLVAGEVFGVRAWNVDSLGRIKSPQFQHIWTPGENVAECQRSYANPRMSGPSMSWQLSRGGVPSSMFFVPNHVTYSRESDTWSKVAGWVDSHYPGSRLMDVEYDGYSQAYEATIAVGGGRKKPKYPQRVSIPTDWIDSVEPAKPKPKPAHDFTTCSCGFYAYLNGTNDYAEHNVIGVVQGYGETFLGTRGFRSSKAKIVAAYASTHADVERVRPLPVSRDRMRELYPDVAWFDDYAAMVAEFPPSDPEPTPDTDPEFWTRSA